MSDVDFIFDKKNKKLTNRDDDFKKVEHLYTINEDDRRDIRSYKSIHHLVEQMAQSSYQARKIGQAAKICANMIHYQDCDVWLTVSGSMYNTGMSSIICQMIESGWLKGIVMTGVNAIDGGIYEGLGFQWYKDAPYNNNHESYTSGYDKRPTDNDLHKQGIDRIYDTYLLEDHLKIVDEFCCDFFQSLTDAKIKGLYDNKDKLLYGVDENKITALTSAQILYKMGKVLHMIRENSCNDLELIGVWCKYNKYRDVMGDWSILEYAYKYDVPVYCPGIMDSACGLGYSRYIENSVQHDPSVKNNRVLFDQGLDFYEITGDVVGGKDVKGIIVLGGSTPQNYLNDCVINGQDMGRDIEPFEYVVRLSTGIEHDGSASAATSSEITAWGKANCCGNGHGVDVWCDYTISLPLIFGYLMYESKQDK